MKLGRFRDALIHLAELDPGRLDRVTRQTANQPYAAPDRSTSSVDGGRRPKASPYRVLLASQNVEHVSLGGAYLEEVVNSEYHKGLERKNNLKWIGREIEDKLQSQRIAQRKLAESLHSNDSEALTLKQQMAGEYFAQLRKEHANVRFELMRAQTQQVARMGISQPAHDDVEIPDLVVEERVANRAEVVRLGERIRHLESLMTRFRQRVDKEDHPTLIAYQKDLDSARNSREIVRSRLRKQIAE